MKGRGGLLIGLFCAAAEEYKCVYIIYNYEKCCIFVKRTILIWIKHMFMNGNNWLWV